MGILVSFFSSLFIFLSGIRRYAVLILSSGWSQLLLRFVVLSSFSLSPKRFGTERRLVGNRESRHLDDQVSPGDAHPSTTHYQLLLLMLLLPIRMGITGLYPSLIAPINMQSPLVSNLHLALALSTVSLWESTQQASPYLHRLTIKREIMERIKSLSRKRRMTTQIAES